MKNPNVWDEYEIKARYIPCFLAAVPLVHFLIQFLGESFWTTVASNIGWLILTNISLSLIVMLALIQLQCGIAKYWVEESVFGKGGINFPTTNLLLFKNHVLSRGMKVTIREKIINDFNFKLMYEVQESDDAEEARRLVREAVGFIRGYVGKGVMTHQYNIRYGFMRNLIGGALWACAGSIGSGVMYGLQKNWEPMALFVGSTLAFFSILIFKKQILSKFAHQYAETLFGEYLTMKGDAK
jgi:hypothetical protein